MTEGCMVINLILATFHLTLGFSGRSDLMLIMGFFYALLSFMRFFLQNQFDVILRTVRMIECGELCCFQEC